METAIPEIISVCKPGLLFRGDRLGISAYAGSMRGLYPDIAARLALLEKVMGATSQTDMAVRILGVSYDRYSNPRRGASLGIELAEIISRRCEVDLSWLYSGLTGNISSGMLKRISEAEKGNTTPSEVPPTAAISPRKGGNRNKSKS